MAIISLRTRRRAWEIGLAVATICFAWLLQLSVLSSISLRGVLCSLPLTLTIICGAVFGSPLPALTPEEVRAEPLKQIMARQALSGSTSGFLIGAAFGALYASVIPVYPFSYPIIGWIAGYFCLRNFSQAFLLCMPIVFFGSLVAETMTAFQLALAHRPDVFPHLVQVALPEAAINALIAPLAYFPMRGWYEFSKAILPDRQG